MKNCILKLPLDLSKRHFVVGDLHGMYDAFLKLLQMINYNPQTDIIYSVGDLIDRGPKSYELVDWFSGPNRHAIIGNHELMAVDPGSMSLWLQNGGLATQTSLINHGVTTDWLKGEISNMPWFIDVGDDGEEHAFRIVHAEIPAAWSEEEFQQVINDAPDCFDIKFNNMLWGRLTHSLYTIGYIAEFHPNRSGRNIFVGHSSMKEVTTIGDMTYLDSTVFGSVTMINAITKEIYSTSYRPQHQ